MGDRLAGKVALITGAARGQGAAEARLFAAEGATVFVTDVLDDVGERLVNDIGPAAHTRISTSRARPSGRRWSTSCANVPGTSTCW